ncbi:hypothetical protein HMPREF0972_01858 [Actinomyces sp. oral taxon 848 str. F0332]|nr:hypothetical protein HMPREF0972_01858 [Actinomyces sp. oral taxon 848 str. F0332]
MRRTSPHFSRTARHPQAGGQPPSATSPNLRRRTPLRFLHLSIDLKRLQFLENKGESRAHG